LYPTLGYVTKPYNSTPKALEIPGILSWNNDSGQPQMVFSCYLLLNPAYYFYHKDFYGINQTGKN
jgi:hypothetical protein